MNRYLVFAFSDYYPKGGMKDHVGSYATLEEALSRLDHVLDQGIEEDDDHDGFQCDEGHIFDIVTGQTINDEEWQANERKIKNLETIVADLRRLRERDEADLARLRMYDAAKVVERARS